MNCCPHCQDAGKIFDLKTAKKELRRYRKKGPNKSTRLLLEEIRRHELSEGSLLDIGSGIGAIPFELLEDGIGTVVSVDASTAYLEIFETEAERRGVRDRIHTVFGDITDMPEEIQKADIVTLDRVICCYPDMEKLVDCTAEKVKRFYGVVYPRKRWSIRLGVWLVNLWFRLRKSDFRTYTHPPAEIDARIRRHGLVRTGLVRTLVWEAVLYERTNG